MPFIVEVVSDVVCPWCFIGKRHLETALSMRAATPGAQPAEVTWLPFQLNPDMPAQGMPRVDYVQRKFGRPASEVYARASAAGAAAGLALRFDRIVRQPNTLKAHVLLKLAREAGGATLQGRLKERLMTAYFMEGGDLSDDESLVDLAAAAGVDRDAALHWLGDRAAIDAVARQDADLRSMGVSGVPFFIFGRHIGVSGAQAPEVLLQAMQKAESEAAG